MKRLSRVILGSEARVLDAYRDPDCECPVQTTFTGIVNGDTIDGTFTTRGPPSTAGQTGSWRVKRTTS
jgi:hypothetical protein